jgi:hypothetical protein
VTSATVMVCPVSLGLCLVSVGLCWSLLVSVGLCCAPLTQAPPPRFALLPAAAAPASLRGGGRASAEAVRLAHRREHRQQGQLLNRLFKSVAVRAQWAVGGCAVGRWVLQRCASVTVCVCAGGTPCGTSAGARARSAQRRCWSRPSATAADRLFARCSLAVGALSSPLSPVRCAWLSRRLWRRRSGSTTSYWLPLVPRGQ